ncbi:unnamed protein product [Trichogramma brassicae]|uniref:Uncharacterized protein n=1 Tax=Trichogramma brassicae TaxID=86971 RepID=A0A6H5I7B2_9HYME|nr:unnamed protein product [Trichogramma brassicae]
MGIGEYYVSASAALLRRDDDPRAHCRVRTLTSTACSLSQRPTARSARGTSAAAAATAHIGAHTCRHAAHVQHCSSSSSAHRCPTAEHAYIDSSLDPSPIRVANDVYAYGKFPTLRTRAVCVVEDFYAWIDQKNSIQVANDQLKLLQTSHASTHIHTRLILIIEAFAGRHKVICMPRLRNGAGGRRFARVSRLTTTPVAYTNIHYNARNTECADRAVTSHYYSSAVPILIRIDRGKKYRVGAEASLIRRFIEEHTAAESRHETTKTVIVSSSSSSSSSSREKKLCCAGVYRLLLERCAAAIRCHRRMIFPLLYSAQRQARSRSHFWTLLLASWQFAGSESSLFSIARALSASDWRIELPASSSRARSHASFRMIKRKYTVDATQSAVRGDAMAESSPGNVQSSPRFGASIIAAIWPPQQALPRRNRFLRQRISQSGNLPQCSILGACKVYITATRGVRYFLSCPSRLSLRTIAHGNSEACAARSCLIKMPPRKGDELLRFRSCCSSRKFGGENYQLSGLFSLWTCERGRANRSILKGKRRISIYLILQASTRAAASRKNIRQIKKLCEIEKRMRIMEGVSMKNPVAAQARFVTCKPAMQSDMYLAASSRRDRSAQYNIIYKIQRFVRIFAEEKAEVFFPRVVVQQYYMYLLLTARERRALVHYNDGAVLLRLKLELRSTDTYFGPKHDYLYIHTCARQAAVERVSKIQDDPIVGIMAVYITSRLSCFSTHIHTATAARICEIKFDEFLFRSAAAAM